MQRVRGFGFIVLVTALVAGVSACAGKSGPEVRIVGDHLELNDTIHFATNEATIEQDSYQLLDRIAFVLKKSPDIVAVKIQGHTDDTGAPDFNQTLSEKRAKSVQAYLRGEGVTQSLDTAGFGDTKPLCPEKTEECRYRNRRVEFIIERN